MDLFMMQPSWMMQPSVIREDEMVAWLILEPGR